VKPLPKILTNRVIDTAVQNYIAWRTTAGDPLRYWDLGFSNGARLAVQQYGQLHKVWSEKELAEGQQTLLRSYARGNDAWKILREHEDHTDELEHYKKQRQFLSRLAMALFGGVALIAPMLIMTLHQSKLTSLLTTSLFVVAVAVTLAWWMEDATSKDIVGATAAYAAVLVVFVGTGTPTTG